MTEPALSFVGVWTALIALGVFLYVLLDGFDLGRRNAARLCP